jgi:hypothetical protein
LTKQISFGNINIGIKRDQFGILGGFIMTILKKLLLSVACLGAGSSSFIQCNPQLDSLFNALAKVDLAFNDKQTFFGTTALASGMPLLSRGHKLVTKYGSKIIGNVLRVPGAGLVGLGIFCIADAINKTR